LNIRKPIWSRETEDLVYQIRKKYPLWGKEKLAIKYQEEYGSRIAVSTLGRILAKLVANKRVDPVRIMYGQKEVKRRLFDGYSKRWKYGMKSRQPGELVQIDHMTVTVPRYGTLKHFTAVCPVTKFSAYQVYHQATSANATSFLEHVRKSFPFPVLSIQGDGGSEFMADFEQFTAKIGIPLFVLPPRRPQLNGGVERGNGIAKYEFYSQYSAYPSFPVIKANLQEFASFYNKVRPHHGIGLLTPVKFYELIKNEVLESHMY
jgi:transposase InsO family protein